MVFEHAQIGDLVVADVDGEEASHVDERVFVAVVELGFTLKSVFERSE